MNKSTVLFFDSGMGGLSVYREAKKLMPDNHYLYCFDNAGFPYSEKSEETIIQRTFCLLYTSPSPRDYAASRMPSSA